MLNLRKTAVFGSLLLFGAAGCADLDVVNPNEPDAGRALASATDVESLIAGSFSNWHAANNDYRGISLALSVMSFQHNSSAANSGMVDYSTIPRRAIVNERSGQYYANFEFPWLRNYRALSAAASGLRSLDTNEEVESGLGAERATRARAWGKFVQGLAHGTLALLYDRGFVIDETVEIIDEAGAPVTLETVPYTEMMDAALGYFDEAIALAEGGSFSIPTSWATREMGAAQLARVARSYKARFRAAVARTPDERAAVDWQAVLDDVEAGIQSDYLINLDYVFDNWQGYNLYHYYGAAPGTWSYTDYFITGMADTSGNYQEWLSVPVGQRTPDLPSGDPFVIVTPDLRFPQGETLEEQLENPGQHYVVPSNVGAQWGRPERGQWRWSYYRDNPNRRRASWFELTYPEGEEGTMPEITHREMRLLAAEAHYRLNNPGAAAEIINETRTEYGLNATDASGTNTSCVPKLPSGECGDLFEMLKWEKRMETIGMGMYQAPWYFEGRGWGDLYRGTALHFPMPALELQTLQLPTYTFGGVGGEWAADQSSYAWPGEQ